MIRFIKNMFTHFRVVNAEDKMDNLFFSNYDDYYDYHYGVFICSNCGRELTFERNDLRKHFLSDFSNLNADDSKKIALVLNKSQKKEVSSFIDFYCPVCKQPVRIYYRSDGGKHAEEAYLIKYIVEKKVR